MPDHLCFPDRAHHAALAAILANRSFSWRISGRDLHAAIGGMSVSKNKLLPKTASPADTSFFDLSTYHICTSYAHYMHIICTLYAHYMHIICTLYAHYMHTTCTLYAHYMHGICTLYHIVMQSMQSMQSIGGSK